MSDEGKSVSNEIVIEADADAVWRALSEGEELKRWFPPDARVNPGVGGSVWLSWGEGMDWEAPIELWEPGHRLRTIDPPPSKLAVDYFVDGRGGETVVRIVHSGFGADAWDEEIDTLTSGWRSFLANLKLYLEQHRGEPRTMARFRHPVVERPRAEVFPEMLRVFGFDPEATFRPGDRYAVTTASRDRLEGVIQVFGPPVNLSATVENLDNAFLMIELEPGRSKCRPAFWLSLYGEAGEEAPALEHRLQESVTRTFSV
jgi:uncharacterized protein YndB with AHSA1/START domain